MIFKLDFTNKSLEEIYNSEEDIITDNNGNIIGDIERGYNIIIFGVLYFYYRTSKLAEKLIGKRVELYIDISSRKLEVKEIK